MVQMLIIKNFLISIVFLAFVPLLSIELAFEALSVHIASTFPQLMTIVEQTYLGLACPNAPRASCRDILLIEML